MSIVSPRDVTTRTAVRLHSPTVFNVLTNVAPANPDRIAIIFAIPGPFPTNVVIGPTADVTSLNGIPLGTTPISFVMDQFAGTPGKDWFCFGPGGGQLISIVEVFYFAPERYNESEVISAKERLGLTDESS